jgi:hypothetical protein
MFSINVAMSGTGVEKMTFGQQGSTFGYISATYSDMINVGDGLPNRRFVELKIDSDDSLELKESINKAGGFSMRRLLRNISGHKKLITQLFESMYDNNDASSVFPSLSLYGVLGENPNCIMYFVNAFNQELSQLGKLVGSILPNYEIVILNSTTTSNEGAEPYVLRKINEAKRAGKEGVLIFASRMAARSFSVPQIQAVVMLYDGGSLSTTTQQSARGYTEGLLWDGSEKTTAWTISIAIDRQKTDTMLKVIVQEVHARMADTKESFESAVRFVCRNMQLWTFIKNSASGIPCYGEELIKRVFQELSTGEILDRIQSNSIDVSMLDLDTIDGRRIMQILSKVIGKFEKREKRDPLFDKVNTFLANEDNQSNSRTTESEKDLSYELITKCIERLQYLRSTARSVYCLSRGKTTYTSALHAINLDNSTIMEYYDKTGLSIEEALELCRLGVLDISITENVMMNEKHRLEIERQKLLNL